MEHSAGAAAGSADATGDEEHGHSVDVSALGDAAVVATILAHSTRRRIEPAICDSRRNGLPKSQKVLLEIEDLFGALCVSFRLLSCRLVSPRVVLDVNVVWHCGWLLSISHVACHSACSCGIRVRRAAAEYGSRQRHAQRRAVVSQRRGSSAAARRCVGRERGRCTHW